MLRMILPIVCVILLVPVVSWAGENPNAKLAMHVIASDEYLECEDLVPAMCESINVDVSLEELLETNGYGCIALLAYDVEGISGLEFALQGWPTARGAPALEGPYWCFDGAVTFGDHRDDGGATGLGECAEPDSNGIVLLGYFYFGPVDSADVPIDLSFLPSTYTAPVDSLLGVTDCTVGYATDEVVAHSGCAIGGVHSGTEPDCSRSEGGPGDQEGEPGGGVELTRFDGHYATMVAKGVRDAEGESTLST